MSIDFACPYCDKISSVPDSFAGRRGKCPGCNEVIEVPDPNAPAADAAGAGAAFDAANAPTLPHPAPDPTGPQPGDAIGTPVEGAGKGPVSVTVPPPRARGSFVPAPEAEDAGTGEERPCPFCGEQIKRIAKKCKFCGEFLDRRLRGRGRNSVMGNYRLASPGARLGAWLIDALLFYVPYMLGVFVFIGLAAADPQAKDPPVAGLIAALVGVLISFAILIYQWVLIATSGASLGKRWLGIKILRLDGGEVGFVDGVILRNWVVSILIWLGQCTYVLGIILFLVDSLLVFAQDRRTLHDHIASTFVIETASQSRTRRRPGEQA